MHSLLDLFARLGALAPEAFWVPVAAWTLLAMLAEAGLRVSRPSARVGLATRGSLVALLPLGLVAPPLLARWVPSVRPPEVPPTLPTLGPADLVTPLGTPTESVHASLAALDWGAVALGGVTGLALVSGALALLVLSGGLVWIARFRRSLRPSPAHVRAEADALAADLSLQRSPLVVSVESAVSPFTVGWWRPLVALPDDLDPEARRMALAHELAHVREAHFAWAVAERLVRAAFVWHPLVHVLGRGLALDRERQADAAVLGLWPDRAAHYGRLLHALTSRPSPRFALGASTSPLLSRLTAMTRSTPERRMLARLLGALVLVLPLLASATAIPDTFASSDSPAPASGVIEAPAPEEGSEEAAPEAAEEASDAEPEEPLDDATPDEGEEVLPPPPARADTLTQYLTARQILESDDATNVELRLRTDASYEIGEAIANYYSAGTTRGSLTIVGNGFRIERGQLRDDALPPAPPPPPPPTLPLSREDTSAFIRLGGTSVVMDADELERYQNVLREELREISDQFRALDGKADFESDEARLRLQIRREAVQEQYRQVIEAQEEFRLKALRESVRNRD